jgi:hypothetical protein
VRPVARISAALIGACLAPASGYADTGIEIIQTVIHDCQAFSKLSADGSDTPQGWTLLGADSVAALYQEYAAITSVKSSLRDINESGPFWPHAMILEEFKTVFERFGEDQRFDLTNRDTRVLFHDSAWTLVAKFDDDYGDELCTAWHRDPGAQTMAFLTQPYLGQHVAKEAPFGTLSHVRIQHDGTFASDTRTITVSVYDASMLLGPEEQSVHPARFLPEVVVEIY